MQAPTLPAGTGFLSTRLLVAVALVGVFGGFLLIADRMTRAGFASPLEITAAVAAALLTGIVFQANYRPVMRLLDRIFLPRRYAAAVALEGIRASLGDRRWASRERAARERLAADVARALGLVSVAVFTRSADGGFVRQAAFGWPLGTAWHLLPGDALSATLGNASDVVVPIPEGAFVDVALPEVEARPGLAVILRRRGRAQSAILLGGDSNGRTPHVGTVRGLAVLLGELIVA